MQKKKKKKKKKKDSNSNEAIIDKIGLSNFPKTAPNFTFSQKS